MVSRGSAGAFDDPSFESHSTEAAISACQHALPETSPWPRTKSEQKALQR